MFSSGSRNRTRILVACLASGTAALLWSQAASPTACRFVRLTITDWPHIANSPLGITESTVFGKALESPNR